MLRLVEVEVSVGRKSTDSKGRENSASIGNVLVVEEGATGMTLNVRREVPRPQTGRWLGLRSSHVSAGIPPHVCFHENVQTGIYRNDRLPLADYYSFSVVLHARHVAPSMRMFSRQRSHVLPSPEPSRTPSARSRKWFAMFSHQRPSSAQRASVHV